MSLKSKTLTRGYAVLFGALGILFVGATLAVAALIVRPAPDTTGAPAGGPSAAGDPSAGLQTFRQVGCAACHGQNGEGGIGPALAGHTEEQIFRQVRSPIGDVMPPFPVTVLSDDDVRDIAAWIATLGEEMVMVHEEEGQAGHDEPELSSTEIAHLRLFLTSTEAENKEDAIRHIEHLALHGADAELLKLAATIRADMETGRVHAAEQKVLELLGPAAEGEFDVISAHIGMAISADDRGEPEDVEAATGHDHEPLLRGLLEDWINDNDRHGVIDSLYEALNLEHPHH
jgi:mono/diheme cytochrome c family protein